MLPEGVCREEKNGGKAGAGESRAKRVIDGSRWGVLAVRWAVSSARRGDVVTAGSLADAGSPAEGTVAAAESP